MGVFVFVLCVESRCDLKCGNDFAFDSRCSVSPGQ